MLSHMHTGFLRVWKQFGPKATNCIVSEHHGVHGVHETRGVCGTHGAQEHHGTRGVLVRFAHGRDQRAVGN